MTSHRLRVSLCTPLFLFIAADAFAEEETDYEAPSQFEKAFYDEGKLNLNTSLYIRHRAVKDPATGKYGLGPAGIQNQTGNVAIREGANKQVISSQADSLIKISRIWADFFPANTSNQPI